MHSTRRWRRLAAWAVLLPAVNLAVTIGMLTAGGGTRALASIGTNDYPSYLASAPQDSVVDPWDFYNRECTSFVAWRLNNDEGLPFSNHYKGAHFGDAYTWAGAAQSLGIPVDGTPTPGSVAVYPATLPGSGGHGHVAFVDSVNNSAGTVTVEEYNFNVVGGYDQRTQAIGALGVQYIHFISGPPPPPPPTATREVSQVVAQADGTVDEFYRGTDHNLWHTFYKASLPGWEPVGVLAGVAGTAGAMASQPSAVVSSAGLVDVFWKGADKNLWHIFYNPAVGWSAPGSLGNGPLGGPPRAVAQSNGVVDVFWRSSGHDQIFHMFYSPTAGWSAASSLGVPAAGGAPASDPAPVVTAPGLVDVFWRGTDKNLWHSFYQPASNTWYPPSSLGMGPLGGAPAAAGQADGTIDVFWRSSGHNALYHAFYKNSTGWQGPNGMGTTAMASDPMAITSSPGVIDAFWRTTGSLGHIFYNPATGWSPVGTLPMGALGSAPYAAGQPNGTEDAFWKGAGATPHLWHAFYKNDGNGWQGPTDFGGNPT